jgi:hypothetical protein
MTTEGNRKDEHSQRTIRGRSPSYFVIQQLGVLAAVPLSRTPTHYPCISIDIIIATFHPVTQWSAVFVRSLLQRVFLFGQWTFLECDYYVMAHAQKPIFVFQLNGQVQVCLRGLIVQSATGNLLLCDSVRILRTSSREAFFRIRAEVTVYSLHFPFPFKSSFVALHTAIT